MNITVHKSARLLICAHGGEIILRAPVRLGFGADDGPKQREGDGRTPEGSYVVSSKNPESKFHLSLGISYPGPHDAEKALAAGVIDRSVYARICENPARPPWDTPLGGYIMIHGQRTPPADGDWTAGCIAVEDSVMDMLFSLASIGDSVVILP